MSSDNDSIGIIGGGISGLSIAYALQKRGIEVTVYEKKSQPGGVIQSKRHDGWLVETGPNTMLVRDEKIWSLFDELQLNDCIVKPGPEAKKRYIVRSQQPVPVPTSFGAFLTSNLLSFSAKCRLLKEPFMSAPSVDDESVDSFFRRRLGAEPLDYAVNPFVSGVYAGDPAELSIKHTFGSLFKKEQHDGSLAKGFIKREKNTSAERALISFDKGIQTLPQTIAKKLGGDLHLNSNIKSISNSGGSWTVQLSSGEERQHQAVVSTLPVHALPDVWEGEIGASVQALGEIDYAPMSVLALGFRRNQIDHPLDGFGMLIPEAEPFSMLGSLFPSSLFPGRAPDGHVLLNCFLGGVRHRELAAQSTESLLAEVMPQLQELLGVREAPIFHHHTYWPKAIPQYKVGYDRYLETMQQIEASAPGFFLGGNFRGGVSVPNCITNGFEIAGEVAQYV